MGEWRCSLEGGPFDGDSGYWPAQVGRLWAFPCPMLQSQGRACGHGPVHWTDDGIDAGQIGAEPYDFDRIRDDGTRVYIYADLRPEQPSLEEVEELVGAGA